MTMSEALQHFTILSIGDGLVSQVPALITSVAAGILVTRAASKNDLGRELTRQLLFYPKALTILAVMMGILAIVPGLPTLPFLTMAVVIGLVSHTLHRHGMPDVNAAGSPATADGMNGKSHEGKAGTPGTPAAADVKPRTNWKICSRWTRYKSSWASASSRWRTRRKAAICWNA